jgi:DNA primase
MISKDTISLVRDRTDIIAVVSESVPTLKRRGRHFTGLCPFHKEKTPSFHVNPETGRYYCFGCKESGDAFEFLVRVEGHSFAEAVRVLAERAGIPIHADEPTPTQADADRQKRQREDLYAVMQMAAVWYEEQLRENPLRSYAVDELARRDLAPGADAVQAFRLGYAPPAWDGLTLFLKKQGVSPVAAEAVGLLVPRTNGTGFYDRFRHRLMFAVVDARGRVVAFSGRALSAVPGADVPSDPPPKYINSPESPIYTKGATLFGLWQARHAVRERQRAIVVEGNFDVVSLHARGMINTVAPLGTAFTVDQAKLLRRYTADVTLLFDGDVAGRKAAAAARAPCDEAGVDAKVAQLPDGIDPDVLVRTKGVEALQYRLSQARDMLDHLIDTELDEFKAGDTRARAASIQRIEALLGTDKDPVSRGMREGRIDALASRLDLVRVARNALPTLKRNAMAAARAELAIVGPRPSDARVKPRRPGYEERKAIVGAVLDFPMLLDDSEVRGALDLLEGESARLVVTIGQCRRESPEGMKVLDFTDFLGQIPPSIQPFAKQRLAAPGHETIEQARADVMANAKKLQDTKVALETRETAREQERDAGDWEAGIERAKHVAAFVRERHGLVRR